MKSMINLRDITKENLIPIIDLDVGEDQKDQVAPNSVSIAEGNYSETAWFKGIFNGDIPVGFVMLNLNIEEKKCYLWRYMIDKNYQGRGYGKAALIQVIDWVKALQVFENIKTSYVPKKKSAAGFYKNLGFIKTGKKEDSNEFGMEYSLL